MNSKLTGKEITEYQHFDIRCKEKIMFLYLLIRTRQRWEMMQIICTTIRCTEWLKQDLDSCNWIKMNGNFILKKFSWSFIYFLKKSEKRTRQNLGTKIISANWKSRKQPWSIKKLCSKGNTNWYNKKKILILFLVLTNSERHTTRV